MNKDDIGLATDGAKSRRDLPAVLYLGAGYRWSDKLQMLVDFNYYFQTAADWGTTEVEGVETNWSDDGRRLLRRRHRLRLRSQRPR